MCIIIDVNVAAEFAETSADAAPILDRVTKKKLRIVTGGQLKREWVKTHLRKLYVQLVNAGSLVEYSDEQVQIGSDMIDSGLVSSNDLHILGLARISGARILFSRDFPLHEDFKNKHILPGDKGKVYQGRQHQNLLKESLCSCK